MPRLLRYLLPVVSGIALSFAYPKWDVELMVWVWLFPLLWVLWPLRPKLDAEGKPERVRGFWPGFLAGLGFWIPNLSWLRHSSRVIAGARDDTWIGLGPELMGAGAVVGLALYCSLYFGLWSWFAARFARADIPTLAKGHWQQSTLHSLGRAFLAAAAWTGLEWVRGTLFTGFGWNGLGVALHHNRTLIQIADIVGVTGLSFLPVFATCTAWNVLARFTAVYRGEGQCRTRLDFTLAMVLLLSVVGYGMNKLMRGTGEVETVRTVLVQPNVPQADAWSEDWYGVLGPQVYQFLNDYTRMYAEEREGTSHTDLVIWPESALPVHLYGLADHVPYFNHLLAAGNFSLLTGTEIHRPGEKGHVSAVLFHGNYANRQEYNKIHLVPFGEYLPFRNIPPFSFLQGVLPGDFDPGTEAEPLKLTQPQAGIIPLICFEDTVGRLARRFVRAEPQMIVNITNDGWFLQSQETEVHLANAKFRAVELRRPMVRAANTGISCFIDTFGTETARLDDPETGNTFIRGCQTGEVRIPKSGEVTFYARFGDAFSIALLAAAALGLLLGGKAPPLREDKRPRFGDSNEPRVSFRRQ